MQDRKNPMPLQFVSVMMKKYDINLDMPPDANTLHAATQTQIVRVTVWTGHSSKIHVQIVWQEIVSGGDPNKFQN